MTYKIPMKVAEIRLIYKNQVKAEDQPKITSSRDAYWVLESNWSDQMGWWKNSISYFWTEATG